MWKMTILQWIALILCLLQDVFALKDVILTIKPEIVERTSHATLICLYDLERAALYTVKWYRGTHEFYRYTPSEKSKTKIFPVQGITVDLYRSNSTQVVLTDIEFQLSGNFSCEVTTAEDPVATRTAYKSMLVVQLPDRPPTISVGREPLDYGDVLKANCSSPPARPPAKLKFILNELPVVSKPLLTPRRSQETYWSDLSLELVLQEHHFNRGKLVLKCVAQIANVYYEEAELNLASARNPVPEKVSAFDGASTNLPNFLSFILFVIIRF